MNSWLFIFSSCCYPKDHAQDIRGTRLVLGKDSLTAARGNLSERSRVTCVVIPGGCRQLDEHPGSRSRRTFDGNSAAVLLDRPATDWQAQPRAFTRRFSSEKGFPNHIEIGRFNSGSRIGKLQHYRWLVTEPDIVSLRTEPRFRELLVELYLKWQRDLSLLGPSLPIPPPKLPTPEEYLRDKEPVN